MKTLKYILKKRLEKSPIFETLIFSFSVILSGVLASAFVTELTVDNEVQWENAFKIGPTYFIGFYIVVIYYYNKFLYDERVEINKFKDDFYLLAYMRKELLPDIVMDFKKDIQAGKTPDFKKFDDLIDIKSLMANHKTDKGQDK